jgi:redox-sensitive bicupin YhaK (pirin superfamily)
MGIEVRPAAERFVTTAEGRETRHSFSFGPHYDPANLGFGALVCHNDDRVDPGAGYPDHPHQEMEIVTWVLSGALAHRDSSGRSGVITPGQVQVMSAGSGIVHSETAEPGAGVTRFVQTWVRPATWGEPPAYAAAEVGADLTAADSSGGSSGGWVPLASGRGDGVLPLRNPGATLWVAAVTPGQRLVVPAAAYAHLFVAEGSVVMTAAGEGARGLGARGTPGATGVPGTRRDPLDPRALSVDTNSAFSDRGIGINTEQAGIYPRDSFPVGEGDAVRLADEGAELVVTGAGQLMLWTFT